MEEAEGEGGGEGEGRRRKKRRRRKEEMRECVLKSPKSLTQPLAIVPSLDVLANEPRLRGREQERGADTPRKAAQHQHRQSGGTNAECADGVEQGKGEGACFAALGVDDAADRGA